MGCMPNSLSGTKSLKNALALRKRRIIYRECRFYIFNYIFLFYLAAHVLRHLNYVNCPCLSFLRIFLYLNFFYKKHVSSIAKADFTYLAIYYNAIMQLMSQLGGISMFHSLYNIFRYL